MENLWKRDFGFFEESGTVDVARAAFMAAFTGEELIASGHTLVSTHDLLEVTDLVKGSMDAGARIIFPINQNTSTIQGEVRGHPAFVAVTRKDRDGDPASLYWAAGEERDDFDDVVVECLINVTAHREAVQKIYAYLQSRVSKNEYAKVVWWYKGDMNAASSKNIFLPPITTKLHKEYYPDIEGGPGKFLKDYLESDAAILLVTGSPGTGKTTLLRHLICDLKLAAHIIYDEGLMDNDGIFQKFLFGKGDVMIIEDADTVLASREHDKNKLMSRFLNVSDGLIKMPDKKLVFTTNITDFGRVDPALTRPGRCFGVLHTRALNLDEAQAAAKVAGVPIPFERKEYTLAQLFNQNATEQRIRKIGFAS